MASTQLRDRPKRPFIWRPIVRREKPRLVTKIDNSEGETFQIGFCATATRISAAHKSDDEFTVRHETDIRQNNWNLMLGETLNAPATSLPAVSTARVLPKHLLYSIFARIGGSGLDTDAFETLRASYRGGFLGKAVAYDNRQ